jgi:hypothetical protein
MRKIYTCFIICILVLTMAGCENYDKAIQGIEKGKEFVDTAAKKVTETREGAGKSIGNVLGKDTGKSDADKSESKENNENKKLVNHFKEPDIRRFSYEMPRM